MSKTIKELADELGLSKTAIRKYLTPDFREKYTTTSETGAILVSDEGANHLKSLRKPPETTANQFAETENQEVSGADSGAGDPAVQALIEQLAAKDRQIEYLQAELATERQHSREQISQLTSALQHTTESLQAAQALHAGTMKKQLTTGDDAEVVADVDEGSEQRKKWKWPWQR